MKVRFSPLATDDIIQIANYLTERNPRAALAIDTAIRGAVRLLGEFPGSGRALTQRPDVQVMPLVRYPYLIFYTAIGGDVLVLHVRHGARAPVMPDEL